MPTTPPCRNKPGFEQPGDYPFWHLNPHTIAAQDMCLVCPLQQPCAREALAYGDTPDGVLIATVICRGDTRTRLMLETIAHPPAPEPLAPVIPITTARRAPRPRNAWPRPCVGCERTMWPRRRHRDGVVRHKARGLCDACYTTERRSLAA